MMLVDKWVNACLLYWIFICQLTYITIKHNYNTNIMLGNILFVGDKSDQMLMSSLNSFCKKLSAINNIHNTGLSTMDSTCTPYCNIPKIKIGLTQHNIVNDSNSAVEMKIHIQRLLYFYMNLWQGGAGKVIEVVYRHLSHLP